MNSVAEVHPRPAFLPAGASVPGALGFPRHAVVLFGAADVAAPLAALGYAVIPATSWTGFETHPPLAVIAGDEIDHPMGLCAALPRHVPKILLARDHSFEIRRAAARAGVQAVIPWPAALPELLEWLEYFEARVTVARASVLLIEDNPDLAGSYGAALRRAGLEVEVIDGPAGAIQALDHAVPDLIVMDISLSSPDGVHDGIELAAIIRQSSSYLYVPIVFLSNAPEQDRRRAGSRFGGDAFTAQPKDTASLVLDIKPRVERARAQREMIERDPLTGLLHQTSFEARGTAELARCRRAGGTCSLAIIAIDQFKAINGNSGRPAGDRVLETLSRLLRSRLRSTDLTGRLGGAEFAVLLPGTERAFAHGVISALHGAFRKIVFEGASGSFTARFSAGIAGSHGLGWQKLWLAAEDSLKEVERIR
jgi:diguanylate cyclase (GGDEF)-like protein